MRDREIVSKPGAPGTSSVTSLSIAAFLMMKGIKLVSGKRSAEDSREFEFIFEDPKGQIEQLSIEFLSSECRKFDDSVRHLRSLVSARQYKK
jgi:hypothetical protein